MLATPETFERIGLDGKLSKVGTDTRRDGYPHLESGCHHVVLGVESPLYLMVMIGNVRYCELCTGSHIDCDGSVATIDNARGFDGHLSDADGNLTHPADENGDIALLGKDTVAHNHVGAGLDLPCMLSSTTNVRSGKDGILPDHLMGSVSDISGIGKGVLDSELVDTMPVEGVHDLDNSKT